MATKNLVPRAAHEGQIGTAVKPFLKIVADEVDIGAVSVQTQLNDKEPLGMYSRMTVLESDFIGDTNSSFYPLIIAAISSGTIVALVSVANHPGIVYFKSSTTPDSGYRYVGGAGALILAGGETFEIIFYVATTTGTTIRLGFHTTATVTAPTDGVYIQIVGTTLSGVAMDNSAETDTGDTVTITQGAWYRAKIVLNANASQATFTLFTCADGQPVTWVNHTITTNIPTTRSCKIYGIATNSGASAVEMLDIDWLRYSINRVLVR